MFSALVYGGVFALAAVAAAGSDGACPVGGSAPWAKAPSTQPRGSCRCFPGDECWPSSQTWKAFNWTIGGRLIATTPLGAPCHQTTAFGTQYDESACNRLRSEWFTPQLHEESPSSVMAPYFTNNSCNPFLPPSAQCVVGSYPSYSVNLAKPSDITLALWFATYFNIRITVKNTGHDYSGKSVGAGSIGLWTHNLKDISFVDYTSRGYTGKAIKVGAGVTVDEAYAAASKRGLVVVGGGTPTVGLAGGYTQGGGHSPLSSKYGLAADQVLEWEVVDGLGRLLRATPSINSDLYWALCGGGGGTYGVVVSMTSKVHQDVPVVGANVSFTSKGISDDQFYDLVSTFHASVPDIVDSGAMAVWFFSNELFSLAPMTAPGSSEDEVRKLLLPLTSKLDKEKIPYESTIKKFPNFYQQFTAQTASPPVGVGQYGGRFIPRSVVQDKNADLTAAYRHINARGGLIAGIGLRVSKEVTGNVWNAVNPAWRDTLIENVIQTPFNYTAPLSDMKAAQDDMTNDLLPQLENLTPGGGAYLNEGDYQQPGWQTVFYGSNYDALRKIKDRYDPFHMFYAITAVGSEYWAPQPDGRLCKAE